MLSTTASTCTRRSLIGGAAAGTALLATYALSAHADEAPTWDREADVVVLGAGGAGLAAAIEAARAGVSVLVLEKASAIGGDSALCDGILGTAGTRLAKEAGIDLDVEDVYAWYMERPAWYGARDPHITRVNAENSAATVDWLEGLGVEFEPEPAPRFGYTDLPFIHQVVGKGAAMVQAMAEAAQEAGVEVLLETAARDLVQEGDNGRVVGVVADDANGPLRVHALRAVVLACGDESGSPAMMAAFNPQNAPILPGSHPALTGDGFVMAARSGAFLTRTDEPPQLTTLAGMMLGCMVNVNYAERLHGLWLDANAQRFYNEETRYFDPMGHRAILRVTNEQGFSPVLLLGAGANPDVQAFLEVQPLDAWPHADTLDELAPQLGLDPQALNATVEHYNACCAAGIDEDFGREAEFLIPMEGPFYAAPMNQSTCTTMGGIKIDEQARALRLGFASSEGGVLEPLPGLYAAGLVCEWNAAIGATVLCAMTAGRIAGANAAAEAPTA